MSSNGWIGVDLDGTLVEYTGWQGPGHIGPPVTRMVDRVKQWLAEGKEVRIFTARIYVPHYDEEARLKAGLPVDQKLVTARQVRMEEAYRSYQAIEALCVEQFGKALPITCEKDFAMIELWDDRCTQVVPNTGLTVGELEPVEAGWLIEAPARISSFRDKVSYGPHWLTLEGINQLDHYAWTMDSLKALRFGRQEDALAIVRCLANWLTPDVIVTEHSWG